MTTEKPDFNLMSRKELRAYLLEHRNDDEAFYAYMDKGRNLARVQVTSDEQLRQLIEEREGKHN